MSPYDIEHQSEKSLVDNDELAKYRTVSKKNASDNLDPEIRARLTSMDTRTINSHTNHMSKKSVFSARLASNIPRKNVPLTVNPKGNT